MATNWSGYEAAKEIMGSNKENIAEIGSRFPLFTRTVACANNDYLLDILKAIPKVTARVIETGLKDIDDVETEVEDAEEKDEAPKKSAKKETKTAQKPKSKKFAEEDDEADEDDYENMTSKALYKLCCDRGISSQCKKRDKASLIAVLKENDGVSNEEEDDWGDEEEETDPYAGKSAKELFKMCVDRGIKTKPKQSADAYVKLLKKADVEEAETEDEDDEDDDWEI